MQITGAVGQQNKVNDGNINAAIATGNYGELIVNERLPRYYEMAYRKTCFTAAAQAVLTTTVGLATTYTGLCLSNNVGNSVNLVLTKVSMMQSVIQSTQVEAYAIATGFNATTNVTHTTPLVSIKNDFVGSGTVAQATADTSATLPTAPFYHTFFSNTGTATADSTGCMVYDLEGSIILPPGAYACWVTPAQASVAGMWFSFSWIEVPV